MSLLIGAEYSLARHFALFGEVGLSYTKSTVTLSSGTTSGDGLSVGLTIRSEGHNGSVSTRSGVGVIFIF